MIFLPYTLLFLFLFCTIINIHAAILISVIIRPVIDSFYETQYAFAGIKPTEYFGFLLPLLILIRIFFSRDHNFTNAPLAQLWIVYIYFQLFSTVMTMTIGEDVLSGMSYFFRALNGFVGFFMFQEFFRKKQQFKILLIAFLIAGVTPLSMSFYQNVLGGAIKTEHTIGDLVRNIGFYHDAYNLRFYCFQTLAAAILYLYFFSRGNTIVFKIIVSITACFSVYTIFKLYSKAGYLILGVWFFIWAVSSKRNLLVGVIFLFIAAFLLSLNSDMVGRVYTVYSKEADAFLGKEKADRLFQGRIGDWRVEWKKFQGNSLALQIIGDGSPHTGSHNDFLRALYGTGVLGLLMYIALLGGNSMKIFAEWWREKNPLNILAIMLIAMWIIDAIGLVPGAYPGYQIFVWGFVGLAIRGLERDTVETENA